MRKELSLQDAAPQLDDWLEIYVDKLSTQLPKAEVMQIGHSIKIFRTGQRVWITLNKTQSGSVHIVSETRFSIGVLAIIFCVIGSLIMMCVAPTFIAYQQMYASHNPNPWYYYGFYRVMLNSFLISVLFLGLGLSLQKLNKTREMQSLALRLARDTKPFIKLSSQPTPPQISATIPQLVRDGTLERFCSSCGTPVENSGAKFCEYCGKNFFS